MEYILHIETSTNVCSVALSGDGKLLAEKVSFEGPSHAALLGGYVEEMLDVLKEQSGKLSAVAVSSGPGSYTGLRIGVSMAKGLCFGYDIPLIPVPTLKILATSVVSRFPSQDPQALYCAMLDARRMEVYATLYTRVLKMVRDTAADIVTGETYSSYLEKGTVCFFGNGAEKCKEVIHSSNAVFVDNIYPLASEMIPLSVEAWEKKEFADVAYFEPFYLKEFIATIAKNKVLDNSNG